MKDLLKRTWTEIDLDRLAANVDIIRERANGCQLMAIVKADAYGHGDSVIAPELCRLGISFFGVSNIEEAISLRRAGVGGEILILGVTPPELAQVLAKQNISQAVFCMEYARRLDEAARAAGVCVKAHLKVDTGMGRIGFDVRDDSASAAEELLAVSMFKGLKTEGIFSHFSVADALDAESEAYTARQRACFDAVVRRLQSAGLELPYIHLQNSAGIIRHPDPLCSMVRMGISMYGLPPSREFDGLLPVKPLMEMKTAVAMVKDIPAGCSVSYGRTFVSERPMRVATVPVGYADGYRRALSNRADMLLHGKRARVLGTVCMDQLMLDVSDIPQVKTGDVATVFGRSEDAFLRVEELAALSDTINYEIICGISRRVPRVYFRGGKPIETVDYLLP